MPASNDTSRWLYSLLPNRRTRPCSSHSQPTGAAWLSASGRSSPRKPREPMFSATMASSSHRERRKAYWRTRTTTPSTTIAAASQSR